MRLSESPITYRRAAPMLGEHTAEVLTEELGLTTAQINELRQRSIC